MSRLNQLTFYTLLITQTFSLIGSRMTAVAISIWIYRETGLTAPLLLTAFFTELPGMLLGSLAGVWVDRWPRKKVLILADAGQAVGSLLLLISFQSGAFQLWHLYSISLLQGFFITFQGPAESATITLLAPPTQRERANGIQELAHPMASTLAPIFTGVIYSVTGLAGILIIDLSTFILAGAVVVLLHIPQPAASLEGSQDQGHWLAEWQAGLRFLRQRPALFGLVLYMALSYFLLNGPLDLSIPYLIAVSGSEAQMGLGVGLMSMGAFSGSLVIAVTGHFRPRIKMILGLTLFNGLLFLAYGTARSMIWLSIAIFLLMVPLPMINALYKSILQIKIPPDLQGRVFGLANQFYLLGSSASFLLVGPLVDNLINPQVSQPAWKVFTPWLGAGPGAGMGLVLVFTGFLVMLSAAAFLNTRAIRNLERDLPDYISGT